jgi:hypothetical protein
MKGGSRNFAEIRLTRPTLRPAVSSKGLYRAHAQVRKPKILAGKESFQQLLVASDPAGQFLVDGPSHKSQMLLRRNSIDPASTGAFREKGSHLLANLFLCAPRIGPPLGCDADGVRADPRLGLPGPRLAHYPHAMPDEPENLTLKLLREMQERVSELQTRYSAAIEAAIANAKASRERETVKAADGAEVYAYPHPEGIAWGVNAVGTGDNILRGVRRPDGQDEGVT